jgi:TRAP-type C4-dicarboxylate transport system permease small subunit
MPVTIAALSWPAAAVYVALIISAGLVVAVLVWSLFRTGQTAIRSESRHRDELDTGRG